MTGKIASIMKQNLIAKDYNKHPLKLQYWYDLFTASKQKNLILKEIKSNIMEQVDKRELIVYNVRLS